MLSINVESKRLNGSQRPSSLRSRKNQRAVSKLGEANGGVVGMQAPVQLSSRFVSLLSFSAYTREKRKKGEKSGKWSIVPFLESAAEKHHFQRNADKRTHAEVWAGI